MRPDFQWVDTQLEALARGLRSYKAERLFLFEPSPGFYGFFDSEEDDDLGRAVAQVAHHPPVAFHLLAQALSAIYLAPRDGQPGVGGKLVAGAVWGSQIQVPFALMGRPKAIGAVIAHELGHRVLLMAHHGLPDYAENECLTDLTGVFIGLGKLLLNGKQSEPSSTCPYQENLGHLPLELTAYAFDRVCTTRGVDRETATHDLTPHVQAAFDSWRCRWPT